MVIDEIFKILLNFVLIVGIIFTLIGIIYGIYKYKRTAKLTTLIAGVTGGGILIISAFLFNIIIHIINSPNQIGSYSPRLFICIIIFVDLLFVSCKNRSK